VAGIDRFRREPPTDRVIVPCNDIGHL